LGEIEKKSEWDAREFYTLQLHQYNAQALTYKFEIEQRRNLVKNINEYFSVLRALYRELKPFIKDGRKKHPYKGSGYWFEREITQIKQIIEYMNDLNRTVPDVDNSGVTLPDTLEERLEKIHEQLTKIRFDKKLIVPVTGEIKSFDQLFKRSG
jgi:hypothetical protein